MGRRKCRLKDSFHVRLTIWMADEIERSNIERREIISIFVRTRRRADNHRRNFDWVLFQVPHHVAIRSVDQPESTKACGDVFLRESDSNFVNALCPNGLQRILIE